MDHPPARVHALISYPLKGCAGVPVERAELTATGLPHDRSFMLVEPDDGMFLSQRRFPAMAVIRARITDAGDLVVSADGAPDLTVRPDPDGPLRPVGVHRWRGKGADQGDRPAAWFTEVLGRPCRLVGLPTGHDRPTPGDVPGRTGFADAFPLLVTSLASLNGLNERIADRGADPVPMNRFRPNVVLDGWPDPHTEDSARELTVGGAELRYARQCVRCTVPTVDQATGRKAGVEPVRTLADYRRHPDGGVVFGANYVVDRPGPIAVGDRVTVRTWART